MSIFESNNLKSGNEKGSTNLYPKIEKPFGENEEGIVQIHGLEGAGGTEIDLEDHKSSGVETVLPEDA